MRIFILFLLSIRLFAVDFDCVVVGTSPFSLFEALYQYHSGRSVLILEKEDECGGAWKGIQICGIPHVDLGCHQIGNDLPLKAFLEEYAGCEIVSLDNPLSPFDPLQNHHGFYFSKGCWELIDHLLDLISRTNIELKLGHKLENIAIDPTNQIVTLFTNERTYTSHKLIVTPMSCFGADLTNNKSKYFHLYLLIQDPTLPRFTYKEGKFSNGISRIMNLTHFTGLTTTGMQIIAFQTHNEHSLSNATLFLEELKANGLVDVGAYILRAEPYIYEAGYFHNRFNGTPGFIEILQTGHIKNLSNYVPKWKQVLKPYNQANQ